VVLDWVQDLHHCVLQTGPTAPSDYLVDLVQENDWVFGFGFKNAVPDLTRIGPHVGLAMALDDGCIVLASQGDPGIGPSQALGNALDDGGFSHSRWSIEQQHFGFKLSFEFADCDELQNALFELVHAVVFLLEDAFGLGDIEFLLGQLPEGIVCEQVYVVLLSAHIVATLGLQVG
jgi:hypothetical protein